MVDATDRAFVGNHKFGMGYEPTYSGANSLFRRQYSRDLQGVDIVAWGVPYDLSVTNRPSCRFGPRGIRAASTNVTWDGGPWFWDFDPFEKLHMVDYGDCMFDPGFPMEIPEVIYQEAMSILQSDAFLLTMGGDHSVTYSVLKAQAERHGPISLIQIDAHSDTWEESPKRFDHGSMFYHAAQEGILAPETSVQAGLRTYNSSTHGFTTLTAEFVHEQGVAATVAKIKEVVGDLPAYLTFDIDALDPAFAPGTGTPVCGGLSSWQAISLIRKLAGVNLIGADMVEVSPPFDHAEITSLAGATLLLEMVCLIASQK
ncbi:Agmatinase [Roseovarius albus]|uniref:Agmatinase n=1 Tax=Roseovarius albus TaxID=1247867 RepID=A0A1X6ZLI4_9RHOB|nr:agmatinase [Roseovarius albus]SLN55210.1 Agmatinase [Roseovarius albus]